ncbi:hypothetical protein [Sphingomonas sp. dw_22]|uniref:hypothetical protein n=1 Tax=Sphingomonas sp. dw_22 TaxID=2721175 RepID=UPI001BD4DB6B|nr:hypothetical protein [Sphingomonas sp. dw_22]
MRIVILALALFPTAAMARDGDKKPAPEARPAAKCQDAKTQFAGKPAEDVRPRSLAQEPLANQYYPVLRRENGCDVPVKIREDVGRHQR